MKQPDPLKFFNRLNWLDGSKLVIEPYRKEIFSQALYTFDQDGRPRYNLAVTGRGKKNYKTLDRVLAALYRLVAWKTGGGNDCYLIDNDEDQSADALDLLKKLIEANPILRDALIVKQNVIE